MYIIVSKFKIGEKWSVSLKGNPTFIHNGTALVDEDNNQYIIESVALVNYNHVSDIHNKLDVILLGNMSNVKVGEKLNII